MRAAIFDVLVGWALDKKMLAAGVRVSSSRRLALAALVLRIFLPPALSWVDAVAFALVLIGPDLAHAVSKAPEAALGAIGSLVGTLTSRFRGTTIDLPPEGQQ